MATAQVNPNPAPRRRSFFGPILLIAAGVVFLLINQGKITPKTAFYWFADWWPALLIVWGVFKMFDYYQAQREGVPYRGIGAGGWVFLIFLMFIGLSFTGTRKVMDRMDPDKWNMVFGNDEWDPFFGQKFEYADSLEQAFPAGGALKVAIDRGSISVAPSSDDKMHISIKKVVRSDNQQEAERVSKTMKPQITVVDKLVTIGDGITADRKGGYMDLEILMPRKAAVDLMTLRGEINVRDREGDTNVHSSRGDVTVERVTGTVTAHMRKGNFTARTIKGDVSVEDRGDDVDVSDVSGVLTLNGEYDSLRTEKIAKGVRFKSSRTDFEVARLDGSVDFSQGQVRGDNLIGPLRLDTRSYDVRFDGVSGDVRVQNQNGEVDVTPRAPFGGIDIQNRRGTVRVGIPTNGGYQVDVRARRGDVDSDFDLSRTETSGEQRAVGIINKGTLKLQVNNEFGSIEIRKGALASAPEAPAMPRVSGDPNIPPEAKDAIREAERIKKEAQKAAADARKQAEEIKKEAEKKKNQDEN